MENIKTIEINDSQYPKPLKKIIDPPRVLYYKGNLDIKNTPTLAVVGTRRCSNYGKQATIEIVTALSNTNIIIVSGMAHGIDTIAHKTALDNNIKTIAVLGTGIDNKSVYPQENVGLAKEIVKKEGAVISEYPPNTPGYKGNFPLRNRIISGLSLGILVIEAKQRSGALITARYALQQKKQLFALPGSIYSPNSQGCNYLIRKGATLIRSAKDILEELKINSKLNLKIIKPANKEEELVIKILKDQKATYIDEIIQKTKISPAKINSTLIEMERKQIIKNLGGNVFAIIN